SDEPGWENTTCQIARMTASTMSGGMTFLPIVPARAAISSLRAEGAMVVTVADLPLSGRAVILLSSVAGRVMGLSLDNGEARKLRRLCSLPLEGRVGEGVVQWIADGP